MVYMANGNEELHRGSTLNMDWTTLRIIGAILEKTFAFEKKICRKISVSID